MKIVAIEKLIWIKRIYQKYANFVCFNTRMYFFLLFFLLANVFVQISSQMHAQKPMIENAF